MADPIKMGKKPDGTTFYWFRISAGRHTVTGKRVQVYKSFAKLKDAKAVHARIVNEISEQRYVAADGIKLADYLDRWEKAHARDLELNTTAKYGHLLRPVRDYLGDRVLQSLKRPDIDALTDWMTSAGRKRGGGLAGSTVQQALALLEKACDDAIEDRLMTMNPVRRVKRPKAAKPTHELWSDDETARFEKVATQRRLSRLSPCSALASGRRKSAVSVGMISTLRGARSQSGPPGQSPKAGRSRRSRRPAGVAASCRCLTK